MYPLSISKTTTTEPDEDGFDYVVKVHGSRIENPLNRYPGEAAAQGGKDLAMQSCLASPWDIINQRPAPLLRGLKGIIRMQVRTSQ